MRFTLTVVFWALTVVFWALTIVFWALTIVFWALTVTCVATFGFFFLIVVEYLIVVSPVLTSTLRDVTVISEAPDVVILNILGKILEKGLEKAWKILDNLG